MPSSFDKRRLDEAASPIVADNADACPPAAAFSPSCPRVELLLAVVLVQLHRVMEEKKAIIKPLKAPVSDHFIRCHPMRRRALAKKRNRFATRVSGVIQSEPETPPFACVLESAAPRKAIA